MDKFKRCHSFVDKWEGGERFTRDPQDPGGATRYGISMRFLKDLPLAESDVDGDGALTWRDVQALEREQAEAFYLKYFWLKLRCHEMPEGLALAVYDTAVNLGSGRAVKYLQRVLGRGVAVDGVLGPQTRGVLRAAIAAGREVELIRSVLDQRERHYQHLAMVKSWGPRFIRGWLNRLADLRTTISKIEEQ